MKEGFYLCDNAFFGVILYEYRDGILSYYSDTVTWLENGDRRTYKFKEYGWFLSKRDSLDDLVFLVFLEDL